MIEAGGFYEIENSNFTQIPGNDVYYVCLNGSDGVQRLGDNLITDLNTSWVKNRFGTRLLLTGSNTLRPKQD